MRKKIFWQAVFEHDTIPFEFTFKRSNYTYLGKIENPYNRHTLAVCLKQGAKRPSVFDMDVMAEGHQYILIEK